MGSNSRFLVSKESFLRESEKQLASATPGQVRNMLLRLSRLTDRSIIEIWHASGLDIPCSLLALGGYGRQSLFPYSDIDVLVLLPNECRIENDARLQQRIELFISRCWDAGMEIGSSVRTLNECLKQSAGDITVQTALLEARLLTGSTELAQSFARRLQQEIDPWAFFRGKTLEMSQRHARFDNTPYVLEPNCKDSPGGLRDLHIVLWVTKASGLGESWDALVTRGLISTHEARQIKRYEIFLSRIRIQMHLLSGRRTDRLGFDMQAQIARQQGLGQMPNGKYDARLGSERLMRDYYWAAKAVTQLNQIVLLGIEAHLRRKEPLHIEPINSRFQQRDGQLDLIHENTFLTHPETILETFVLLHRGGFSGLSAGTLRALYNARQMMGHRFRTAPENRAMFISIFQQNANITKTLRLMNHTSVLGRYLWVFRRIVGQMQHDLFHVYTVDQHILMVIHNLHRFFMPEHAHEYPFCSRLAAGWEHPWQLYVAALFHDIAKGRGGDHSVLAQSDVRKFCRTHSVSTEDAELIEFLVREHLTMSRVAQKQDLTDPEVIARFAALVGDERRLTALYLLTVADIRGTSPKVWNSWKGQLLEDLYQITSRTLGGHAPDPGSEVEAHKRDALVQLAQLDLPHQTYRSLWDNLDLSYFMSHEGDAIAWHTRHVSHLVSDAQHSGQIPGTLVQARLARWGEGLEVMVYTPDQPDVFARICSYFDQANFSVLDARIHTTHNAYALDTFQLISGSSSEYDPPLISMVESGLQQTLQQQNPLPTPSRSQPSRRAQCFPMAPRITLLPDERAQSWILSVTASDRLGLLYRVALVLARNQINLKLAKISTLGERVEDTFLIEGSDLHLSHRQLEIETELILALQT